MTFEQFVEGELPSLLRFAKVLCGDRGLAEDVVQEVLMRAFPRWPAIELMDKPQAYVRRMIVNEYLSWRRRWSRVTPVADVASSHTIDGAEAQITDRAALVQALAVLPRRQRAVVVLRYYGGLTDVEIARDLGCSPGTVRSHLSRALATLRINANAAEPLAKEA